MAAELPYTTYIAVLLPAFLSVFATLLGVALAIYIGRNERAIAVGIGFSAGVHVRRNSETVHYSDIRCEEDKLPRMWRLYPGRNRERERGA